MKIKHALASTSPKATFIVIGAAAIATLVGCGAASESDEASGQVGTSASAVTEAASSEPGGPELPYCGGTQCTSTEFCAYNNDPFRPNYWCQAKQADGDSCVSNGQCLSGNCKMGWVWGNCVAKATVVDN